MARHMTKGDLIAVAEALLGVTIDSALPQSFFNDMGTLLAEAGVDEPHPTEHFLGWAYSDGKAACTKSVMGFPLPMTTEGWTALANYWPHLMD